MQRRVWVVVGLLVLASVAGSVWVSTSLLVLRAALPGEPRNSIGAAARGTALEPVVVGLTEAFLPAPVRQNVATLSRWVYGFDNQSGALVGWERPTDVRSGWDVITYPWATVLEQQGSGAVTSQGLGELLQVVADIVLHPNVEAQPALLIQLSDAPGPFGLSGTLDDATFRFTYNLTGAIPTSDAARLGRKADVSESASLHVALPSAVLKIVPSDVLASVEGDVVSGLGFTKTLPDVFELLEQGRQFGLRADQENGQIVAVGVTDNAAAIDQLDGWVALERAYDAPTRRAFRLPDGTVGYELIPSPDADAAFSEVGDDGCQIAVIRGNQMWRCQRDSVVTIGVQYGPTRELLAQLAHASATGQWSVLLPSKYATLMPAAFGLNDSLTLGALELHGQDQSSGWGWVQFR